MKKIILAIIFMTMISSFTSVMAQEAVITNQENVETIVDEQLNKSDERFEEVASKIRSLFGESLGDAIELEIQGLSDQEKKEIVNAMVSRKRFDSHGPTGSETIIAMTAIVFSIGLPVLLVLVLSIYGIRKRRQQMDLVQKFLDAGKDVPEELLNNFASTAGEKDSLQSGLTLVAIGAAIGILGLVVGVFELSAIGLIPGFIGVARLFYWKHTKDNNSQLNG